MSEEILLPARPAPTDLDAKLADFDSTPLFMRSLPAASEDESNTALAALQNLAYEGTPDEIAQNFKDQGNDYFKGKRHREAAGFYQQGIDAKPTDPILKEALLCNRAACNLELKNFGSVLRDCGSALALNPKSSKAYYRSALALLALSRPEESLDCCTRCLEFDPDNSGVKGLKETAEKRTKEKIDLETKRKEKERREKEERRIMKAALAERNIIVLPSAPSTAPTAALPYPPPSFDPEDPSTMIFPVIFLYPQYATSDLVPTYHELTPFADHLSLMFPPQSAKPDWDVKGQYVDDGRLVVYAVTKRKRLLKVGKKMSLRDLCNAAKAKEGDNKIDGLEMKDGCLSVLVLVKGEVEKNWVDEFKRNRDGGA